MSELDLAEVAERFKQMSEPELMAAALHYDELVEPVQALLRDEFSLRSLEPPLVDDDVVVPESRTLVTVRKYRDLPEAFVARSVLESAGIQCFLQDENTVRTDWLWSNMIGGARLQVAEADANEAEEILSQPIPESFSVSEDEEFIQPKCPQCGSLNVGPDDRRRKVVAAGVAAFTVPLPMILGLPALAFQSSLYRSEVWSCFDCGCMWQDDGSQANADSPSLR